MARKFTLCSSEGALLSTVSAADDSMMLTNMGRKRADSLTGSTPASVSLGSGDGEVAYAAKYGGLISNEARIEHVAGDTGPGHESRALGVGVNDMEVSVVFATDGSGNSIVPTSQQVADLVNADPDASEVLVATAGGTGLGQVATQGITPLTGGLDDGDHLKFEGNPPVCCRINLAEVV